MRTAKVFSNGVSQAIRLPKEFRFDDAEVMIGKLGDVVVIVPKHGKWKAVEQGLAMFTQDFLAEDRTGDKPQGRSSLR